MGDDRFVKWEWGRTLKTLKRFSETIDTYVIKVSSYFLILIAVLICVQVLTRALGISFSGSEELARYLYIIFVFLAWPSIALRGNDLRISILSDMLPARGRRAAMAVFHVIMAVYACLMLYSIILKINVVGSIVAASNTWFQMKWLYYIVGVGIVLLIAANVIRSILLLARIDDVKTQSELNEEEIASELAKTREMAEELSKVYTGGGGER